MKKIVLLFCVLGTLLSSRMLAQCSSCTTTITGIDNANHIIGPGVNFCIAPSGTCTGLITVAGGSLCNQGHITSSNLWVANAGSYFYNYGTVTTTNVLVSGGAEFHNNSVCHIDSLLITNQNSLYTNGGLGNVTNIRFAINDSAQAINYGVITTDYMGDSLGFFFNNFTITVNIDFANSYQSYYNNQGFMAVNRDFYNSTNSDFITDCMIPVGRNFYNTANINSNASVACAGFTITGISYNDGVIGNSTDHVDICDVGHPATGIDLNTSVVANTVTFCSCTNICVNLSTAAIEYMPADVSVAIYPNPTSGSFTIDAKNSGVKEVKMMDVLGNVVYQANLSRPQTTINIGNYASGIYFVQLKDEHNAISTQKLIVR